MSATATQPTKQQILDTLRAWIRQRPGLNFGNYGDVTAYRAEQRGIAADRTHAERLLSAVEMAPITGDALLAAFDAFSGRMTWRMTEATHNGKPIIGCVSHFTLDYCTGQYWPTEYRKVVCAIAARALWNHYREEFCSKKRDGESDGAAIRREFRRLFGRTIQQHWLD